MAGDSADLETYKTLSGLPVYASAEYIHQDESSDCSFVVSSSVVDHTRNIKHNSTRTWNILNWASSNQPDFRVIPSEDQEISGEILLSRYSPSGKKKAVLREVNGDTAGSASGKRRFVEVWSGSRLEIIREVTGFHGEFYTDAYFSSLSFSSEEHGLIWTAEAIPKPSSDEDRKAFADDYSGYRYTPDFGERFTSRRRPTTYLLVWGTPRTADVGRAPRTISALYQLGIDRHNSSISGLDRHHIAGVGQVSIVGGLDVLSEPDQTGLLYGTCYSELPSGQNLGIIGCFNRPSVVVEITFTLPLMSESSLQTGKDTEGFIPISFRAVSRPNISARSPRYIAGPNPKVIWLGNESGGPHATRSNLFVFDASTGITTEIRIRPSHPRTFGKEDVLTPVGYQTKAREPHLDMFTGIFAEHLPQQPIVSPGIIALNTIWGPRRVALYVRIDPWRATCDSAISPAAGISVTFLASNRRGLVLEHWSETSRPGKLVVRRADEMLSQYHYHNGPIHGFTMVLHDPISRWVGDYSLESLKQRLDLLETVVIPMPSLQVEDPNRFRYSPPETFVVRQRVSESESVPQPCITFIHGGPHTTSLIEFTPSIIAMALAGYTVNLPNYTGSLGFGKQSIDALLEPGTSGTLEVEECMASIQEVIKLGYTEEGKGKQFVWGGSHGGFIAAHLIAKYPDFFSAAVLRNPVIDLPSLVRTNDIPDWGYEQFGIKFPCSIPTDAETLSALTNASPLRHAKDIVTPTLFLVGEDDRRVPPTQAKALYHELKERMKDDVEMLVFKKNGHPLDKVEAARVSWAAAMDWIGTRTKSQEVA